MSARLFVACQVEGCGRTHKARGFCASHYQQFKMSRPITPEIKTRDMRPPPECTEAGCHEPVKSKGLCQMHYARLLRHGHTRRSTNGHGPLRQCSVAGCTDHHYALGMCHKHHIRARKLKVHGLTISDVTRMIADQEGRCAICKMEARKQNHLSTRVHDLCVDHDHKTGAVRGMLCDSCNRGIGLFGDDISLLEAALAYLKRHAPEPQRETAYTLPGEPLWPPGFVN